MWLETTARRAAAVPVKGDRGDGARRHRDADAGAEAVHGGQDGILAGERHGPSCLCRDEPDLRQQVVQRRERVTVLRACGDVGVRHDWAPSSGPAAGSAKARPWNSRAASTDPAANMPAVHQNAVV
jgi:hypothetical protein